MAETHTTSRRGLPRDFRQPAVGERHGHVIITAEAADRYLPGGQYQRFVRAQCECGAVFEVRLVSLRNGTATSCGSSIHSRARTHGATSTRTFNIWRGMHDRCNGTKASYARHYCARGITVCERWTGPAGFANFLADMGECPAGLTIDRVDNNGNYEPGNCRWVTRATQCRNTRRNVWVTDLDGERVCLTDACKEIYRKPCTVTNRARKFGTTHQVALDQYYARAPHVDFVLGSVRLDARRPVL